MYDALGAIECEEYYEQGSIVDEIDNSEKASTPDKKGGRDSEYRPNRKN